MPRIAIVDTQSSGHHIPYLGALLRGLNHDKIKYLLIAPALVGRKLSLDDSVNFMECDPPPPDQRGLRRQMATAPIFANALSLAKQWEASIVHFIYSDWHLPAIALTWSRAKPNCCPILTLHWPSSASIGEMRLAVRFRHFPHLVGLWWMIHRHKARVIVHHTSLVTPLREMMRGSEITAIPYPIHELPKVPDNEVGQFRDALGLRREDKLILCFGATRYDKGADLAASALAMLHDQYHLLIAGEPAHFDNDFFSKREAELGVRGRLHRILRFLSEEEASLVFHACDIVLLPYRRNFGGQSGPLMQGASIGKTIVAADLPAISDTIQTYQLGSVFSCESVEDMVHSILSLKDRRCPEDCLKKFLESHSPWSFANAHREIYTRSQITDDPRNS